MTDADFAERKSLPLMGWTQGLIGREVRLAAPLLISLAILYLVGPWLVTLMSQVTGGSFRMQSSKDMAQWWTIAAMFMAFLLGVLCGAEEEENRTSEFTRCLPLSPMRILGEKVFGSFIAFAGWAIITLIGMSLLSPMLVLENGEGFLFWLFREPSILYQIPWSPVFYFCALACGVWIGRVLPAAIIAGILGIAVLFPVLQYLTNFSLSLKEVRYPSLPIIGIATLVCGFGFMAAAARYLTRAGLMGATESRSGGQTFGIKSKDWQRRRLVLGALVLLNLVAFPVGLAFGGNEDRLQTAMISIGASLLIGAFCLGIMIMDNEEYRMQDGLIYALPIPRGRIWAEKLSVLFLQWSVLVAVALAVAGLLRLRLGDPQFSANYYNHVGHDEFGKGMIYMVWMAMASLPVLIYGACLSFYIRSKIVLMAAGPLLVLPLGYLVAIQIALKPLDLDPVQMQLFAQRYLTIKAWYPDIQQAIIFQTLLPILHMLLLAAALIFWLRFLIKCATLQEMTPALRGQLAVLFAIVLTEGYVLFLMCNWRDLAFLLFGI